MEARDEELGEKGCVPGRLLWFLMNGAGVDDVEGDEVEAIQLEHSYRYKCCVFPLPDTAYILSPGISYTEDKLLQTRIFSYADTQVWT